MHGMMCYLPTERGFQSLCVCHAFWLSNSGFCRASCTGEGFPVVARSPSLLVTIPAISPNQRLLIIGRLLLCAYVCQFARRLSYASLSSSPPRRTSPLLLSLGVPHCQLQLKKGIATLGEVGRTLRSSYNYIEGILYPPPFHFWETPARLTRTKNCSASWQALLEVFTPSLSTEFNDGEKGAGQGAGDRDD